MIAIFPELVAAAQKGQIETLSVLTRQYFGNDETFRPKPDVEKLIANIGIKIERMATGCLGALLAKDEKGRFVIVFLLDPNLDELSSRFIMAHQLGHYLLDIQPLIAQGDWQVSGYREDLCPMRRYATLEEKNPHGLDRRRELRADAFAAALLMPKGMVTKAFHRLEDPKKIAKFFGVSTAACLKRLNDLALLAPKSPEAFLDAESALITSKKKTEKNFLLEKGSNEKSAIAAPLSGPVMPRSFAAACYGQTDQRTRAPKEESLKDLPDSKDSLRQTSNAEGQIIKTKAGVIKSDQIEKNTTTPNQGLARIRELAQKLEKERLERLGGRPPR